MLAQAVSGFMSINGFPDGPPTRSGQSISDYYAGMLCAFSIVSALRYRDRTGKGQHIDIALLDSILVCLDNLGERYTIGGRSGVGVEDVFELARKVELDDGPAMKNEGVRDKLADWYVSSQGLK